MGATRWLLAMMKKEQSRIANHIAAIAAVLPCLKAGGMRRRTRFVRVMSWQISAGSDKRAGCTGTRVG